MKDIQSLSDSRRIGIKKVGVKTVTYPIRLRDKFHKHQHTVAVVNMYVNLPHHFKGTHMSRFVEILNDFHGDFDINKFSIVLEQMKNRLEAEASHLELSFPFFLDVQKKKEKIQKCYQCKLHGSLKEKSDLCLSVEIPVNLPQKDHAISRQTAFFQNSGSWGKAEIAVRFQRFFWIEDLIETIERAVESQRADFNNCSGLFSTDTLGSAISEALQKIEELRWFSVRVRYFCDFCSTFAYLEKNN